MMYTNQIISIKPLEDELIRLTYHHIIHCLRIVLKNEEKGCATIKHFLRFLQLLHIYMDVFESTLHFCYYTSFIDFKT